MWAHHWTCWLNNVVPAAAGPKIGAGTGVVNRLFPEGTRHVEDDAAHRDRRADLVARPARQTAALGVVARAAGGGGDPSRQVDRIEGDGVKATSYAVRASTPTPQISVASVTGIPTFAYSQ